MKYTALILALALAGCGPSMHTPPMHDAVAIDGDTFAASDERWRLARIDTPEMPGHCRPGRRCVPGDPVMAKQVLAMVVERKGEAIRCRKIEKDRYGRWIAECHTRSGLNLSDLMLATGLAQEYRSK